MTSNTHLCAHPQIESEYYDRVQQRCQQEKLAKHRLWSWGNKEEVGALGCLDSWGSTWFANCVLTCPIMLTCASSSLPSIASCHGLLLPHCLSQIMYAPSTPQARRMQMTSCDELDGLNQKLGMRFNNYY